MKTFKKISFTFMLCFMFIAGGSNIVKAQQNAKLLSDCTVSNDNTDLDQVIKKETKKTCSGCTGFVIVNQMCCDITLNLETSCGDVSVTIPYGHNLCMNGCITTDCGDECVLGIRNPGPGGDVPNGGAPNTYDFGTVLASCGSCTGNEWYCTTSSGGVGGCSYSQVITFWH